MAMNGGDNSGIVTIRTRSRQWMAFIVLAAAGGFALILAVHRPRWGMHAPAAVLAGYVAVVAIAVISGWVRALRMGLRLDSQGVTVTSFLRTRPVPWSQVSHLADGYQGAGDGGEVWRLAVVLRDGGVITSGGELVPSRRGEARAATQAAAIQAAAAARGIPAELRGRPVPPGFYDDPGGQPGVRYWTGCTWSPLLPAAAARAARVPAVYPGAALLPPPDPRPGWHYARSRAMRRSAECALLALLWGSYAVWVNTRKHGGLGVGDWLIFAVVAAFVLLAAGLRVRYLLRLDRAAKAVWAAGTATRSPGPRT